LWKLSNIQLLDIFRRHIDNLQSLADQTMSSNPGDPTNNNIHEGEESSDPVGTSTQQNAGNDAMMESVSAQIMYDAAQGGYAPSLYACTPSSTGSAYETPRSMAAGSETLTNEVATENCISSTTQLCSGIPTMTKRTAPTSDTETTALSHGPIPPTPSPKPRSRQEAIIADRKQSTTLQYASDELSSEEEVDEGQEGNDGDIDNREDDDILSDRSAALVFKGPEILANMWDKASRAGRLEVMREVLYDTISTLRARGEQGTPDLSQEWHERGNGYFEDALLSRPSLTSKFRHLKRFLEVTDAGEHLSKLRKRVALARFYDGYMNAMANSHNFLSLTQKEKLPTNILAGAGSDERVLLCDLPIRRRGRPTNLVHQRIIDLMFPSTILGSENVNTEEGRAIRVKKILNRKAASRRILNWKANGRPWSELVKRFGLGILLLLPTDLSDEK
jgi:hypothetical protein